jgi:tetratricopeptide (TPR) repeat protein
VCSERIKPEESRLAAELEISNIIPSPPSRDQFLKKVKEVIAREEKLDPVMRKIRQASGLLADNQADDAMNLLRECANADQYKVQTNTLKGEVHIKKTEYEEAEKMLKDVLSSKQTFTPAKQLLAKVYSSTGRQKEAIGLLKDMVANSPLNLSNLVSLGNAYFQDDDMDKAKESFQQAKDLDPNCEGANTGLGTIAFKEGDFAMAKEFLSHIQNTFEIVRNINNVAIGLVTAENFADGVKSYMAAIELLNGREHLHLLQYNLGLAYKKWGDNNDALRYFAEAFLTKPDFKKAYDSFAKLVKEMRVKGEKPAQEFLDKVKAHSPKKKKAA